MSEWRPSLLGLSREHTIALVSRLGFKNVHGARIWRHAHALGRDDFDTIDSLPRGLTDSLAQHTTAAWLPVIRETVSSDGFTRKFLLSLDDGTQIETVLMRYAGRVTACVSTQAGCAMGCVFCATGQMGFTRHLTTAEIVAQVLHVARVLHSAPLEAGSLDPAVMPELKLRPPVVKRAPSTQHSVRNVVLMGMGEPLHNYDATIAATRILSDRAGLALSPARMTISTVGVIPGIVRLADEREPISLAVSLHGATQDARAAILPIAHKWPLSELMEACRYYCDTMDRHIFYEWTLIECANDSADDAHALGALLRTRRAHVNLIPLNPTPGYDGTPTSLRAAKAFQAILAEYGLPSTIRQRRGIDIAGGCGQLAAPAALTPSIED